MPVDEERPTGQHFERLTVSLEDLTRINREIVRRQEQGAYQSTQFYRQQGAADAATGLAREGVGDVVSQQLQGFRLSALSNMVKSSLGQAGIGMSPVFGGVQGFAMGGPSGAVLGAVSGAIGPIIKSGDEGIQAIMNQVGRGSAYESPAEREARIGLERQRAGNRFRETAYNVGTLGMDPEGSVKMQAGDRAGEAAMEARQQRQFDPGIRARARTEDLLDKFIRFGGMETPEGEKAVFNVMQRIYMQERFRQRAMTKMQVMSDIMTTGMPSQNWGALGR